MSSNRNNQQKISNVTDLRTFAIEAMQDLRMGKLDITEAAAIGKLVDTVANTLKVEIEYGKVTGDKPVIPFLDGNNLIEGETASFKRLERE